MGKFVNGEICAKIQRLIENEGLDYKQVAYVLDYHPYTVKRIISSGYDYVAYRTREVNCHKNTYTSPDAIARLRKQGVEVPEVKKQSSFKRFLASFFND